MLSKIFLGKSAGRTRRASSCETAPRCRWSAGLRFGSRVLDVLDGEVKLVGTVLGSLAELGAALSEHPQERNFVLFEQRQHPVVEDGGGGKWRLAILQLGEADFTVRVDHGLLIDVSQALASRRRTCPARRNSPGTRSRIRRVVRSESWRSR